MYWNFCALEGESYADQSGASVRQKWSAAGRVRASGDPWGRDPGAPGNGQCLHVDEQADHDRTGKCARSSGYAA